MQRYSHFFMVSVVIVALLAACVSAQPPTIQSGAAATGGSQSTTGYPVTIESCGHTLTFTKAPERVLIDYQTQLELFLRLGLGDRIVAYSGFGEVPLAPDVTAAFAQISGRASKLDAFPNKEQAVTAKYDLVTMAFPGGMYDVSRGRATRGEWEQAGTQIYESNADCANGKADRTLSDSFQQIRDIGRIFNVSDRAEALVAQMQQTLDMVQSKVKGLPKPKVAILDYIDDKNVPYFYAAGIYTDMIERAGGENVFADQTRQYTEISPEVVATRPVDVLFVMQWEDTISAEKKADYYYATFPNAPVSKNHRSAVLTNMELNAGSGNAIAIEKMARALHPEAFAESTTAASGYPLTIQNCGKTLTFTKAPERVLVTYQNVAEILVALGLTDKIVGVTYGLAADPPADMVAAVNGLNYLSPPHKGSAPKEVELTTHPDLVLAAYMTSDFDAAGGMATQADFAAAGAQVYGMSSECTGADTQLTITAVYSDVLNIGKIFGVENRAQAVVQKMKDQIADVQRRVAGREVVKAAIYDSGEGPLGFYSSGLYADLVRLAGGESVFAKEAQTYVEVSAEAVAASNPDIFVIDDYASAKPAAQRVEYLFTNFPNTTAAKTKRFILVKDIAFTPGIRNGEAVVEMAKAFHPDAFK